MSKKVQFKDLVNILKEESKKCNIVIEGGKVNFLTTLLFKKCEDVLLKYGSARQVYEYALLNLTGTNFNAISNKILESGDLELNYLLPTNCSRVNFKKHEDLIMSSGNAKYCAMFAKEVKGASVELLQDKVIESNEPEWCYYLAKHVEDADLYRIKQVVDNSSQGEWIVKLRVLLNEDLNRERQKEVRKSVLEMHEDECVSII